MCVYLDGLLSCAVASVRAADSEDARRCGSDDSHTVSRRHVGWFMDGEWYRSHLNILWCSVAVATTIPVVCLCHLCIGVATLWQFVDHHCHHRRSPAGHQPRIRHQRSCGGRCHHLWQRPISQTSACTVVPPILLSRSISAVLAPVFTAASAAPMPAGPPPTTTTS